VDTRQVPDGTYPDGLSVLAQDAADNQRESGKLTVRIDNTPPRAVPVEVEGGESWRAVNGYAVKWTNPAEVDRAPITAANYEVCRAGGADCKVTSTSAPGVSRLAGLQVPGAGEWQVSVWREDQAGNTLRTLASAPVKLRYDPDAPTIGFGDRPPSDPRLVSVSASDPLSGLDPATAAIEISRAGSGTWSELTTTTKDGGATFTTMIDDENADRAPGTYLLRATVHDRAGNEASAISEPITLPVRVPTVLQAGAVDSRRVRKVIRRHGHRRKVWRKKSVLSPRTLVSYGARVKLGGRLTNTQGNPIPGAQVFVYSTPEGGAESLDFVATTDASGRYTYEARATANREIRFRYDGNGVIFPAGATVAVRTRGHSTIRTDRRRALNGGRIMFSGRVSGYPLPDQGKLIEVQVRLSTGRWQTFRTTRTDPTGRWTQPYRFRTTCGRPTFRFRAKLAREAGYPFEKGRSRTAKVTVRGPACR
jgi:hypothetical protein